MNSIEKCRQENNLSKSILLRICLLVTYSPDEKGARKRTGRLKRTLVKICTGAEFEGGIRDVSGESY